MFNLSYQNVWFGAVGWYHLEEGMGLEGEASSQHSSCSHGSPAASKPGKEEGDKTVPRDFGGGGGLVDGCLLIANTGWIFGIQYNALLWVKVIAVRYLCAGSLAEYPRVIAK